MDAADREVIDDLYRVLAPYERPESFQGCPCGACWGSLARDGDADVVVPAPGADRPLRELDEGDLENIVDTVPGTSGDLDVYRHYLPRVLEILALGGWLDDEIDVLVTMKLHQGPIVEPGWEQWPEQEAEAVARFLDRFGDRIVAAWADGR